MRSEVQTLRYFKQRLKAHGLSETTYWALMSNQNGVCAICKKIYPEHIDHCHESGKVRGLLCRGCNLGLGFFLDKPEALRAAAFYLENPTPLTKK